MYAAHAYTHMHTQACRPADTMHPTYTYACPCTYMHAYVDVYRFYRFV